MTATQRSILDVLDQPHNLDQIAAATDLPTQNVQADLSLMQIHGAIEKSGSTYQRKC